MLVQSRGIQAIEYAWIWLHYPILTEWLPSALNIGINAVLSCRWLLRQTMLSLAAVVITWCAIAAPCSPLKWCVLCIRDDKSSTADDASLRPLSDIHMHRTVHECVLCCCTKWKWSRWHLASSNLLDCLFILKYSM